MVQKVSCITASFTSITQGHIFCQLGKLFISYPGVIREQNVHASLAHAAGFVSNVLYYRLPAIAFTIID